MRRNWFIAAIVIGVLAIVVAAIAMRLSDDDAGQPTTEEWAGSVCSSLTTWGTSIQSLADLKGQTPTADELRAKLDDASDATSQLVTELRDLGAPDTEAGQQLQDQLDSSSAQLQSDFDSVKESAQAVADAPASELPQKLSALATDFATLFASVSGTVTTLQSLDLGAQAKAELQQAFNDAPACESVRAQS